jgi:hypothetical protein
MEKKMEEERIEKRRMEDENDHKEKEQENVKRTLITKGRMSFPDFLGTYCHVYRSVTNNSGFWIGFINTLFYNQLQQLTVHDCRRLAPF